MSEQRFGLWVAWVQGGDHTAFETSKDALRPTLSVFNETQSSWFSHLPQPGAGNGNFSSSYHNPGQFTGAVMCLGSVAAQQWATQRLQQVILDFDLDMLEHDQPIITHSGCDQHGHDHVADDVIDSSRAAAEGYYNVYDTVRNWSAEKHREMFFEDCVNGGRVSASRCCVDTVMQRARVRMWRITDTLSVHLHRVGSQSTMVSPSVPTTTLSQTATIASPAAKHSMTRATRSLRACWSCISRCEE